MRLTKEQLGAIADRTNAATRGPWKVYFTGDIVNDDGYVIEAAYDKGDPILDAHDPDLDFVANARADIPAMLDHIAGLEDALEQADEQISQLYEMISDLQEQLMEGDYYD